MAQAGERGEGKRSGAQGPGARRGIFLYFRGTVEGLRRAQALDALSGPSPAFCASWHAAFLGPPCLLTLIVAWAFHSLRQKHVFLRVLGTSQDSADACC